MRTSGRSRRQGPCEPPLSTHGLDALAPLRHDEQRKTVSQRRHLEGVRRPFRRGHLAILQLGVSAACPDPQVYEPIYINGHKSPW